jgi:membrane-anchored glycerophosphoryl diester phosphodiesterase (GDPDase)
MVTIYNDNEYDFQPEATRCYNVGWKVMGNYFVELLVIAIIYAILSGPTSGAQWRGDEFNFQWYMFPLIIFGIAYGIFVAGPISYGAAFSFLKAVRGERVEIRDIFSVFQRNYWNAVIANVVVSVIVLLGFIMLIVPGFIFAVRLAFVPYLVVDKKMDIMEALRVSWDMTRGYGWQIFFMGFLAIFIVIAGLLLLFVGVFVSIMWISTAFAAMYHSVEQKDGVPELNYVNNR